MIDIHITAHSTEETVAQIQQKLGGEILNQWGEHILKVNNQKAKGSIRFVTFDWGVSLLEYDITFYDEVTLKMEASNYNPIHFAYCLEGYCKHHFEDQKDYKTLQQFQSVIITSKEDGKNYGWFPKNTPIVINVIQITRTNFIKRKNDFGELNKQLYKVFQDTSDQKRFAYYGSINLKLADLINQLRKIKQKGFIRILMLESMVYRILSSHIILHDKDTKGKKVTTSLDKHELKVIRKLSKKIIKEPAENYDLETLEKTTGLPQAKLQEGFKLLFKRTVIEYLRYVRLEKARVLMNTTDYNVSQIVYAVGFSSRSYFSKIFKERFNISPSAYLKKRSRKTRALNNQG